MPCHILATIFVASQLAGSDNAVKRVAGSLTPTHNIFTQYFLLNYWLNPVIQLKTGPC